MPDDFERIVAPLAVDLYDENDLIDRSVELAQILSRLSSYPGTAPDAITVASWLKPHGPSVGRILAGSVAETYARFIVTDAHPDHFESHLDTLARFVRESRAYLDPRDPRGAERSV